MLSVWLAANDFKYLEENRSSYSKEAQKMFGYLEKKGATHVGSAENKDGQLNLYKPEQFKTEIDKYLQSDSEKKYMTVFWFFSTSMPDSALKRYMALGKKLKQKYPNFQYYAVLRGFPKKTNLINYANRFKDENGAKNLVVKIHPNLFDKFSIEQVPAFALGFCPQKFKAKDCEFLYFAKGDMGLDDFFRFIGDENSGYKRFYFDLIEAQ